jgi:hypothetical protein
MWVRVGAGCGRGSIGDLLRDAREAIACPPITFDQHVHRRIMP